MAPSCTQVEGVMTPCTRLESHMFQNIISHAQRNLASSGHRI